MTANFIEKLPRRFERKVAEIVHEDEKITIKLKGDYGQILVATDRRVIIIKSGFMTGNMFGLNIFQLPHSRITNVEVKFGIFSGHLELSTGGMQNTEKSVWKSGTGNPLKAQNCIWVNSSSAKKFRDAANYLMALEPITNIALSGMGIQKADIFSMLSQLGQLKDRGVLSASEFEAKKLELLAGI